MRWRSSIETGWPWWGLERVRVVVRVGVGDVVQVVVVVISTILRRGGRGRGLFPPHCHCCSRIQIMGYGDCDSGVFGCVVV
jgi:hypothetical protein